MEFLPQSQWHPREANFNHLGIFNVQSWYQFQGSCLQRMNPLTVVLCPQNMFPSGRVLCPKEWLRKR